MTCFSLIVLRKRGTGRHFIVIFIVSLTVVYYSTHNFKKIFLFPTKERTLLEFNIRAGPVSAQDFRGGLEKIRNSVFCYFVMLFFGLFQHFWLKHSKISRSNKKLLLQLIPLIWIFLENYVKQRVSPAWPHDA